jgi:murein L,D-transpeptidase YcbB/YkuD
LKDLERNNQSDVFDEELKNGLKNFQRRHGLIQNGLIDDNTFIALTGSLDSRIVQIGLNMKRLLTMPEHFKGDNIVVNIPEYVLYVYNDDNIEWKCNVVVGNDSNNTVVFNDSIEMIVFSPTWGIPKSIMVKESVPAILKDDEYLANHNMEVLDKQGNVIDPGDVDWDDDPEKFEFILRQKPGPNNALGRVKFLLPNKHSIYLHDTPSKSLFNEQDRAFSHGCIRVSEPIRLAEYLLKDRKEWTTDSIHNAMNIEKEIFVKLKNKVPVYLTYFTAWVDDNGKINFRDDIYGHDEKFKKALSKKELVVNK